MESIGCALESLEWNILRFGPGFVFPCWHVAYLMVTWVTCNFKSSTASSFLTFFSRQHMMHRTLKPTRMSPRATWLLRLMELISFGQDVTGCDLLCPLSFQWCIDALFGRRTSSFFTSYCIIRRLDTILTGCLGFCFAMCKLGRSLSCQHVKSDMVRNFVVGSGTVKVVVVGWGVK